MCRACWHLDWPADHAQARSNGRGQWRRTIAVVEGLADGTFSVVENEGGRQILGIRCAVKKLSRVNVKLDSLIRSAWQGKSFHHTRLKLSGPLPMRGDVLFQSTIPADYLKDGTTENDPAMTLRCPPQKCKTPLIVGCYLRGKKAQTWHSNATVNASASRSYRRCKGYSTDLWLSLSIPSVARNEKIKFLFRIRTKQRAMCSFT